MRDADMAPGTVHQSCTKLTCRVDTDHRPPLVRPPISHSSSSTPRTPVLHHHEHAALLVPVPAGHHCHRIHHSCYRFHQPGTVMSRHSVLLSAVVLCLCLASLLSVSHGRVCSGEGYDLSALTYADMSYSINGWTYYFRPCSNVSYSGCTALENQLGGSMMCQVPTAGGTGYDIAIWNPAAERTATWRPLANMQGVQMAITDGQTCGSATFLRSLTVNFICDRTVTSGGQFINMTETSVCNYLAVVKTSLVCPAITTPGQGCSAFGYDFTPLSNADLVFKSFATNYTYYYRACGVVTSPQCANNPYGQQVSGTAMMCQSMGTNNEMTQWTYDLASWNPNLVHYTTTARGVQMFIQDGASEAGCLNGMARALTINYVCNPNTPGNFSSLVETAGSNCDYHAIIETSIVCPPSTVYTDPVACGGVYELDELSSIDLSYSTSNSDGSPSWTYVFRPCSKVTNQYCQADAPTAAGSMLCQLSPDGLTSYNVASYDPTLTTWNPIPNGISMYTTDGQFCGAVNANRSFTANFICDPGMVGANARMTNFVEVSTCNYVATVTTSLVCAASSGGFCGQNGYDFAIAGTDLAWTPSNGAYTYYFRPCGQVVNAQCNSAATTGSSMMCQAVMGSATTYDIAFYDANLVRWYRTNNGWQMYVQDGQSCSNLRFPRALTVNFVCDPAANTPVFNNLTEPTICSYVAYVTTVQACRPAPGSSTGVYVNQTNPYGDQWSYENAAGCGGPYDLTSLSSTDLAYVDTPNGYTYVLRPCGTVSFAKCQAATNTRSSMFCQADLNDATTYNLAVYNGFVTQYTPMRNGVRMTVADGSLCGPTPRVTNIYFQCDQSATTARLINVTESPMCTYNAVVMTNMVCAKTGAVCGGAGYDLSYLANRAGDLSINSGGYNWYFKPCGVVSASQCNLPGQDTAGVSMMCQASIGSNTTYDVAIWNSDRARWTAINSNGNKGVQLRIQDGTTCGSNDFERMLTVNFYCDQSGQANFTSISEVTICNYVANINTGRACSDLLSNPSPSSSSSSSLSGGAIAGIVIGVVVGALLLLMIALVVCCGLGSSTRGKKGAETTENYGKGEGKYGEVEPSSNMEMSDVHKEDETA